MASLPSNSIAQILRRLGADPGRRGRTRCPLHDGHNPTAFSYDEEKGVLYCHRCAIGGDTVKLVMLVLRLPFKDALIWLGVDTPLPVNSAEQVRERRRRQRLRNWATKAGRKLRCNFLERERIEAYALQKLKADPENELGWGLVEIAFKGKDQIEHFLDLIDGDQADQLMAFRAMELKR